MTSTRILVILKKTKVTERMTCVRHQTHLYLNLIGICAITNDNDISFV